MEDQAAPTIMEVPAPPALDFAVVGLGASAGGLQALLRFFEQLPQHSDMAFAVVMHFPPDHESNAPAILQRVTRMPVRSVTGPVRIEKGHVYVIAPGTHLVMRGDMLDTVQEERPNGLHVAVDRFLRSLAEHQKDRSFGIVLSGTGSDGALGMARIKEMGGVTLAQLPDDAEHDGMPLSSIQAGIVDFVLPVVEMPQKLIDIWKNSQHIKLPPLSDAAVLDAAARSGDHDDEEALREVITVLRSRTGHDFHHYKRATVLRRLERRLQVRTVPDLVAYSHVLRDDPDESALLLKDLLIGVTQFFRDRESFEALERDIVPELFRGKLSEDQVRVWVAASATGEEAYSLAMLLCDEAAQMQAPPEVQVFATDIDERAIATARSGCYPDGIVTDMPPTRLREYFAKEDAHYRVRKPLRDKVLFAAHNLLRDPPFSKLDMISCRNLMIYLNREVQSRILEMFHFALNPGGILFLGGSETADALPDLFEPVDKKHRIYRAKATARPARLAGASPVTTFVPNRVPHALRESERRKASFAEVHQRVLAESAPPSLIINQAGDIVHLSESAGNYLRYAAGEPSRSLLALVMPELRLELRTALFQAQQSGCAVLTRPVPIERDGKFCQVSLTTRPFDDRDMGSGFVLVLFDETELRAPDALLLTKEQQEDTVLLTLEQELQRTKSQLQDTIETAETSNEELKASNEELQAINEELRSATEELETGKEELQSLNEELITVNHELKNKVEETVKVNDDLQNLIAATDIATVFVDHEMHIMRYTPRATQIFNIIPGDIGRSLHDITHRLDFDELASDAAATFASLRPVEREVRSSDGSYYLVRMLPYRTMADRIEGAVLTFIDITGRRDAEERLRLSQERMRLVAASTMDYAIITFDTDGRITSFNRGAERLFGYAEDETLGRPADFLYTPEDQRAGVPMEEQRRARVDGRAEDERWHVRKDGSRLFCSGVMTPLRDRGFYGYAKIARDITGRQEAESLRNQQLDYEQRRRAEAQAANKLKDEFLAVMSHELKHPLNLIHINAELLARLPEANANRAIAKSAQLILNSAASQAKIIDDLLDFSRLNTGKLTLALAETDLCAAVDAVLPLADNDPAARNLHILREDFDCPAPVWADRVRLEQVIANLLTNAIKFSRADGRIVLRLVRDGDTTGLEVSDDGQGIDPEFLPHVFDMFGQSAVPTTRSSTGLGIGLALVRQIVELHGGRVEAASSGIGKGARFTIWLPAASRPAAATVQTGAGGAVAGMHVLLVDDTPETSETFQLLLEFEGASVTTATSGPQALGLLDSERFDLIISDIGMPGMDGYAFMREVRRKADYAAVPSIALTGFSRDQDIDRAGEAGFSAHLGKPASVADVVATVARLKTQARS
jgi:two-component system CheB/CheR fusion protein